MTVMSPEGKPIQVNAMALQSAVTQNAAGVLGRARFTVMELFSSKNSS